MQLTKEQWKQLTRRLSDIESSIMDDRKDIDRIQIDIATIREQNDKILGMQNRTQGKISDAVSDAVSETVEPLNEKMDAFLDKKVLKISKTQIEKLNWLQKLHKNIRSWR